MELFGENVEKAEGTFGSVDLHEASAEDEGVQLFWNLQLKNISLSFPQSLPKPGGTGLRACVYCCSYTLSASILVNGEAASEVLDQVSLLPKEG